jgi:uridine kinase
VRPAIIGIAGGTASGKTTFCDILLKELGDLRIKVLKTDGFFKEQLPKAIAPLTGKEFDDYNHPDSLDYDRFMDEYRRTLDQDANWDVIILEGLMVLYFQDIRKSLDLKIFIDLDADERFYRRLSRNMKTMGWTMEEIAEYYLESVKYREKEFVLQTKIFADIILNGNNLDGRAKDVVISWIRDYIA